MLKKQELTVFTKAKELSSLIFTITKKAPVAFRWNYVNTMLKLSTDIVEMLYEANGIKDLTVREVTQRKVDAKIRTLSFFADMSRENQIISFRQLERTAELLYETRKALFAWIRGTKDKDGKNN